MATTAPIANPAGIPHTYHPSLADIIHDDEGDLVAVVKDVLQNGVKQTRKAVIGITSHPERRAAKYSGFAVMVVIGQTPRALDDAEADMFREYTEDAERLLIAKFRRKLGNERAGGAGRPMPGPRFFLYVCVHAGDILDAYLEEIIDEFSRKKDAVAVLARKRRRQQNPLLEDRTGPNDELDPWP